MLFILLVLSCSKLLFSNEKKVFEVDSFTVGTSTVLANLTGTSRGCIRGGSIIGLSDGRYCASWSEYENYHSEQQLITLTGWETCLEGNATALEPNYEFVSKSRATQGKLDNECNPLFSKYISLGDDTYAAISEPLLGSTSSEINIRINKLTNFGLRLIYSGTFQESFITTSSIEYLDNFLFSPEASSLYALMKTNEVSNLAHLKAYNMSTARGDWEILQSSGTDIRISSPREGSIFTVGFDLIPFNRTLLFIPSNIVVGLNNATGYLSPWSLNLDSKVTSYLEETELFTVDNIGLSVHQHLRAVASPEGDLVCFHLSDQQDEGHNLVASLYRATPTGLTKFFGPIPVHAENESSALIELARFIPEENMWCIVYEVDTETYLRLFKLEDNRLITASLPINISAEEVEESDDV